MASAFTSADGCQLAIDMLLELRELGRPLLLDDSQGSATRRCAAQVGPPRSIGAELEHGFAAVLTDFIAGALDGAAPDPDFYETEEGA
jgi:hypothetical protein